MKHISFGALCAVLVFGAGDSFAATMSHLHANGIVTNNIAVMQHSIMLNAFNKFDGSMATIVGHQSEQTFNNETEPRQMDKYGEMLYYGEYGDDGTVFSAPGRGRSGGDSAYSETLWIDWQHAMDHAKFNDFKSIDSDYDLISLGFANEPDTGANKYSRSGGFGGVAIAREDAQSIVRLSETGEYVGLYYAHYDNGFTLQTAADFGALYPEANSDYASHDFSNLWAGAALNASYDFFLDEVSVLQPGLYASYTWIHTHDYEPQPNIDSDDFHMFEISPSLRAITHIADGWYAAMSARYVFNFANGGETRDAGVALPELELQDYCEYGLTVEKNIDRFNLAASVNRRDGGRTGWITDIHMKYIF